MTTTEISLAALCVLVLAIIAFFAVFRGRGNFNIKTPLGEASAEGENPPPSANVPGGVKIKDADAGTNLTAHSAAEGGVDLEKVKAKGGLKATHTPGDPPPKA